MELESRYEALRRHALETHYAVSSRDGLAVLLSRGMAAWMDAWFELPAPAVRTVREERRQQQPPLPDGMSTEIVHVLAAMALGHVQEMHA